MPGPAALPPPIRAHRPAGLPSICCSWGSAQEAAALVQVAAAFPQSQLAEVGLCRLQQELLPPSWGFGPGSLPPIGASPDALIRHCMPGEAAGLARAPSSLADGLAPASTCSAAGQSGGLAASPAAGAVGPWDIDGLLARLQLAGTEDGSSSGSSGGGGRMPPGGSVGNHLIEVVEVKNTCPFGHSRRWAGRREGRPGLLLHLQSRALPGAPA